MASPLVGPLTTPITTTITPVSSGASPGGPVWAECQNLGANPISVEIAYSFTGSAPWIVDYEATNSLADIAAGSTSGANIQIFRRFYLRVRATSSGGDSSLKTTIWLVPTTDMLSRTP